MLAFIVGSSMSKVECRLQCWCLVLANLYHNHIFPSEVLNHMSPHSFHSEAVFSLKSSANSAQVLALTSSTFAFLNPQLYPKATRGIMSSNEIISKKALRDNLVSTSLFEALQIFENFCEK